MGRWVSGRWVGGSVVGGFNKTHQNYYHTPELLLHVSRKDKQQFFKYHNLRTSKSKFRGSSLVIFFFCFLIEEEMTR